MPFNDDATTTDIHIRWYGFFDPRFAEWVWTLHYNVNIQVATLIDLIIISIHIEYF